MLDCVERFGRGVSSVRLNVRPFSLHSFDFLLPSLLFSSLSSFEKLSTVADLRRIVSTQNVMAVCDAMRDSVLRMRCDVMMG